MTLLAAVNFTEFMLAAESSPATSVMLLVCPSLMAGLNRILFQGFYVIRGGKPLLCFGAFPQNGRSIEMMGGGENKKQCDLL